MRGGGCRGRGSGREGPLLDQEAVEQKAGRCKQGGGAALIRGAQAAWIATDACLNRKSPEPLGRRAFRIWM